LKTQHAGDGLPEQFMLISPSSPYFRLYYDYLLAGVLAQQKIISDPRLKTL